MCRYFSYETVNEEHNLQQNLEIRSMNHPSFSNYALVLILLAKEHPKYIIRIVHKNLIGVLGIRDHMYD